MLQNVHLHGQLKRRFGGVHRLDVKTPAEAVLALSILKPGFQEAIAEGTWRVVRGPLKGGRRLGEDQLHINLGGELHILAAPRGSGGGRGQATAKVVVGVALIAATVITAGAAMAAAGAAGSSLTFGAAMGQATVLGGFGIGVTGTQAALFGLSLVLAGASQLLAPMPKANDGANAGPQDVRASHLFSGALNSPEQGVPVPLAFGRMRVGGIPISQSIEVEDIAT